MKHTFNIFSVAMIFVLLASAVGLSPTRAEAAIIWESVGLPGFSAGMAGYPSLAVDNGMPYVAYVDGGNGNRASVMKFNGTSWVTVGTPGFSADWIDHPSLVIDNGTLYVAYQDWGNAGKATVMKFGGSAWVAVGTPGFSTGSVYTPSLVIDNGTLYIAYKDAASSGKATVMKFDGSAWVAVGTPGFSAGGIDTPSLTVDNGMLYVSYRDWSNNGKATVMKSNAVSGDWVTVGTPGFSAKTATYLSLAVNNDTPYVVYQDWDYSAKATVMKFNGSAWVTVGMPGFSIGRANYPSLAVVSGVPYVAYMDYANGYKASVMKFDGTNWIAVGAPGFSAGQVDTPSLVIDNSTLYVAYQDWANSNKATVMKFVDDITPPDAPVVTAPPALIADRSPVILGTAEANSLINVWYFDDSNHPIQICQNISVDISGDWSCESSGELPEREIELTVNATDEAGNTSSDASYSFTVDLTTWEVVGTPGFSSEAAWFTSLAVNHRTPYVAYMDWDKGNKATVMKFIGNAWEAVGTPGFSTGIANLTSIALDGGIPYVAYVDTNNYSTATVMKFDALSENWATVGAAGFSPRYLNDLAFAVDNGISYVAYTGQVDGYKATVMKYDPDSGNWVTVGTAGFSAGEADDISLAVDHGTLYVAYADYSDASGKATVMKYDPDSGNWVTVGVAGFSAGEADDISLAVDNGTPYVAYADHSDDSGKATVMKFDGSNWTPVGVPGFSSGTVFQTSLVVNNGTPYLAYKDGSDKGRASVVKFDSDSGAWISVGAASFSNDYIDYLSFAVDNGRPYVAYKDLGNNGKATVMRLSDRTPPDAPVVTAPPDFTNDATPIIRGTSEPESLINVGYFDDSNNPIMVCQNVQADGAGDWSCVSSVTLPEREIELAVHATDEAGNISSESLYHFTVDLTDPDAPVVNTPARSTNDATPTISGIAEPESLVHVLYRDGASWVPVCQNLYADEFGNWSCDSSVTLPAGRVELAVNATDAAGNQSTNTSRIFTVAMTGSGGPGVAVYIHEEVKGNHALSPNAGNRQSYESVNNGPVKIVGTNTVALIGSERVIYKVNGVNVSFSEMMALPDHQLDDIYWLPWYNNVDLDTQLRLGNVSGSTANVHVFIGGTEMTGSPFTLMTGQSTRVSFAGVNDGPVKVESDHGVPIVASERVIYQVNKTRTSFTEMMASPDSQLNTIYWLPWYNNVDLDTQLRLGNVSNNTATVHIYIGTTEMTGSPVTLNTGQSTRLSFAGVNDGPVKIESDENIVASERIIYKVKGVPTSFSEMMALPNVQLSGTYWLPWYNSKDLDTQLRFGNVSDHTATVHVYVGGVEMTGSPFTLAPGESTRQTFAGINNGPVKIESDENIVASERIIYKVKGIQTSFTEMMALPNNELNTTYWLPWYNNVDLDTQLRLAVP